MSENFVECPICESPLQLPGEATGQFRCPFCQRVFEASVAIRLDDGTESAVSIPLAEPSVRPSLASQVSFDKKSPIRLTSSGEDRDRDQIELTGVTRAETLRDEIKRRKLLRGRYFFVSLFLLIVFISFCGGMLIWILNRPASDGGAIGDSAVPYPSGNSSDESEDLAASQQPPRNALTEPVDRESASAFVAPPRPTFFFWSKNNARDVWKNTRPHLLHLDIEDPLGKSSATGVLIDSRGWVLTSYHAIADAWRIEASAATAPLDEPQAVEPLRDLVRGIVASDPQHDLAILSVNRRFVVSFVNVNIASNNRVVQGQYLLQCGPPSRENYFGIAEVKIETRCETSALDPAAKLKATALGLDDAANTWLKFSGGQGIDPGMPLFDRNGNFQAMASFTKQGLGYALPVDRVSQLLRKTSGDLQPLKTPIVRSKSGEPVLLTANEPARILVAELNRAAAECQQFQWLPADIAQYGLLQSFGSKLAEAKQFVNDRSDPERKTEEQQVAITTVLDAVTQWEQKIIPRIAKAAASDPESINRINQFAAVELRKANRNAVLFFGSLHVGGLEVPRLILKFANSDRFVSVPFDPEAPVMRPGTSWLFCLQTPPLVEQKRITLPDEETVTAQVATIRFAIGPVEQ